MTTSPPLIAGPATEPGRLPVRRRPRRLPYWAARLGQALIVLFLAHAATFLLLQALPGDALIVRFEDPNLGLSQQEIEQLRVTYGADAGLVESYLASLTGVLTGDLGHSVQYGTAVTAMIAENLPHTLRLAGSAFALAILIALTITVASALAPLAWLRDLLRSLPSLFAAVPVFWLAIVLVQVLSFQLGWVRYIGATGAEALILPVLAIAVPISAPMAQVLVRSIDQVALQPFVSVARAKGAGPWWLLVRTVARNAIPPSLTVAGVLLGELIGGAVVTETVFGRAGIGRMTEQAVGSLDLPVLQGVVLVAALAFVLVNLAVDLLYPVLDPRLRQKTRS